MHILKQINKSFFNMILSPFNEWWPSAVDITTDSLDADKAQILNEFKWKLSTEQQEKFDQFYKTLDTKKQDDLFVVLPKIWDNVEQFINHIESITSKETKETTSDIFTTQKEKFKDNPEILEKINEIEAEISEKLELHVEYNENYTKLFQEVLTRGWNPEDPEYKQLQEFINQKIHTVEMMKNRIWNLEIEIKTMESKEQKEKRYEWLEQSFDNIKTDEKLKDIIWEKDFDKLTAGDIYAMLKSNPEKMSWLLLSTSDWNQIDLSWGWEEYKWVELKVNFWKNKSLDKIIWAWDILDISEVKKVKINWVEWERKASPRPGFYTPSGRYLAIHDWYKVEITDTTKLSWDQEIKEFNDAKEKRFEEIRGWEVSATLSTLIESAIKENPKSKQIENPYKSEVDKALIKNILGKDENKYLGVTLNEDWNIVVWEDFNIGHLWEALSWYKDTSKKITDYLKNNKSLAENKSIEFNISELWLDNNREFLENAFKNIVWNEKVDIYVDWWVIKIDSSNTELTIWEIFSTGYEYMWNWTRHEKYISSINAAASKYGVPSWAIIQLIYHENRTWNPNIKAPWSSAYGLWQMINSTWNTYGEWDRNNPADQLMATAKYMKHIQENKNCSWEEVLAYYNTWEWIMSWRVDINTYYNLNPAITNKIPWGLWRSDKNYFIWAVAYYNDISFDMAKTKTTV